MKASPGGAQRQPGTHPSPPALPGLPGLPACSGSRPSPLLLWLLLKQQKYHRKSGSKVHMARPLPRSSRRASQAPVTVASTPSALEGQTGATDRRSLFSAPPGLPRRPDKRPRKSRDASRTLVGLPFPHAERLLWGPRARVEDSGAPHPAPTEMHVPCDPGVPSRTPGLPGLSLNTSFLSRPM